MFEPLSSDTINSCDIISNLQSITSKIPNNTITIQNIITLIIINLFYLFFQSKAAIFTYLIELNLENLSQFISDNFVRPQIRTTTGKKIKQ